MAIALLLLVLAVPAHSAIELQGLHAYADRERVPYRFGVSKLGLRIDDRVSDENNSPGEKDVASARTGDLSGVVCPREKRVAPGCQTDDT